ncbi:MAG: phosphate ABC transporter permease PstA [Austwickia sp.]|nr:phosphate ABC transporter permease PstA [Austwickia sp.]MBK8435519.1 phosphate ABC transporter permease PstA [Austwickia sp.]MBK9100909.1 phosphate ABC transporter permease PstA [Austwickia sp.]
MSTTADKPAGAAAAGSVRGKARGGESSPKSMIFLSLLWLSLFIAMTFLVVLIATIVIDGYARLGSDLLTQYSSSNPRRAGARAAILGSLWVIVTTALIAIPLGVAAAVHLEEFADRNNRVNRLIELNIQNLAAVPSVVYGLLTLGVLGLIGVQNKNIVLAAAMALALLILPVIIIATREALRAVPMEIRQGSLALGATPVQTLFRQTLPSATPGIATGSILALSRAMGEAAPLLLLGALVFVSFDPNGLLSGHTTLPIQIFSWSSRPQAEFHTLAAAASLVLLVLLLAMNALAIAIRNRYQRRW